MNIVNSLRSGGLVGCLCTVNTSFRPRTPPDLKSCSEVATDARENLVSRQEVIDNQQVEEETSTVLESYSQPVWEPKGSDGMVASISMILPSLILNVSGMSVSKGRRVAPEYLR